MKKKLLADLMGVQITDELIEANKRYERLGNLYDKLEESIDELDKLYLDKEAAKIKKTQDAVYKEMMEIYEKVKNEIFLSRMVTGAMLLKEMK